MLIRKLLLVAIAAMGATACTKAPSSQPPAPLTHDLALSGLKQSEFSTDSQQFARPSEEMAERGYQVLSYALQASFDWQLNTLKATVVIDLERKPGTQTILLDSHVERIVRVEVVGNGEIPFTVDRQKGLLEAFLPKELTALKLKLRVGYEAKGGSQADPRRQNLVAISTRVGDPAKSRVLYTHSEPRAASAWMPCNDRPDNRAIFQVEFSLPVNESLIANGRLIRDEISEGQRIMAYKTDQPIPSYLMAFAQGDFVAATRQHGALPIAIWARRGVEVDLQGLLDETDRQISLFEKLLVPFPFEKYVVVLLPEFGGGMEHASITFNDEQSSSQRLAGDLSLMGHELGHQWFGDLVTERTGDDLWIKEGMATLLASESARTYEDEKNSGILNGDTFSIVSGQAMRDPKLAPEAKYNSGPYGRSAWFLTQLRAQVGETAFWGTLRKILLNHAYGSVSSEEFIEAFRPALGDELYKKALKSIDAHETPQIHPVWESGTLRLTLADPEGALLTDLGALVTAADGSQRFLTLKAGETLTLEKKPGQLAILDPRDVHPELTTWIRGYNEQETKALYEATRDLVVPTTPDELALFKRLPPNAQTRALEIRGANWQMAASEYTGLVQSLTAASARFESLHLACQLAAAAPETEASLWKGLLEEVLTNPPLLGIKSYGPPLNECRNQLPPLLIHKFAFLAQHPEAPAVTDAEFAYFARLPLQNDFKTWAPIAKNGSSLRRRETATFQIAGGSTVELPDAGERRLFLRDVLANSEVQMLKLGGIMGLRRLNDIDSMPLLASTVVSGANSMAYLLPVATCAAWTISKANTNLWQEFLDRAAAVIAQKPLLQGIIKNPEQECRAWNF